nr:MAG TPA: zinc-ribbon containing domain protein [Caudoviricetes sp.]
MYCGKCGKKIPDGCDYCMYCGTKANLDSAECVVTKTSNKKKIIIFLIIIVLIIVAALGLNFSFFNSPKIEGKYYGLYTDKSYIEFSKDGTYKEFIMNDSSSLDGTWTIKDKQLILKGELLDTEEEMTPYKNYIVYSNYTFKGEIPSGSKFDVTCTSGDGDQYIFSNDGTMKYLNAGKINKGIYSREGEIITFHFDDEKDKTYKLLIYGGGINNSVYYKK